MGTESQGGEEFIFTNVRIPQIISSFIHLTIWSLTFLYMFNYLVYGNLHHRVFGKSDSAALFQGYSQNSQSYKDIYDIVLPHASTFF